VKITVIATGFDAVRAARSAPAAAPMRTPVDLHHYTSHLRSPAAPAATGAEAPRLTISRRPALEMPATTPRAVVGAGELAKGPGEFSDADLELNLDLDVPAFLRRHEG
jgi:hypothetical protein